MTTRGFLGYWCLWAAGAPVSSPISISVSVLCQQGWDRLPVDTAPMGSATMPHAFPSEILLKTPRCWSLSSPLPLGSARGVFLCLLRGECSGVLLVCSRGLWAWG